VHAFLERKLPTMSRFIKFIIPMFIIGIIYIAYNQEDDVINHEYAINQDNAANKKYKIDQKYNIEIVRNGILYYDKSLTISEAFDNWKACHTNPSWTSFQTDNKRRIVQFTCNTRSNHLDKHLIFQFTVNKDKTFILTYIGEEYIDTDGILSTSSASRAYNAILEDIYENKTRFELN